MLYISHSRLSRAVGPCNPSPPVGFSHGFDISVSEWAKSVLRLGSFLFLLHTSGCWNEIRELSSGHLPALAPVGLHGRARADAVGREGKVQSVVQWQNPQIVLLLWEDKWDLSERLFIWYVCHQQWPFSLGIALSSGGAFFCLKIAVLFCLRNDEPCSRNCSALPAHTQCTQPVWFCFFQPSLSLRW